MKNRTLIIILLTCSCSYVFTQNKQKCEACVFLDPNFKGTKALYDKPNGKIIKIVQHNFKEEDYIGFEILYRNDSMFYVSAYYAIKGFISKGWIKKDKHIGIYSSAYNCSLKLYIKPTKKSRISYIIKEYDPKMLIVIDCFRNWLKVKTTVRGKIYIGWMSRDMQCCNVYSTCS